MAIGFAVVARALGAVTDGGALMGVLVAFVLMLAAGLAGFLPLLTVFVITVLATRWGYARKQRLGVAERGPGRTASQVLANLGATALCALPVIWFPQLSRHAVDRAMAALAEAAADTVSSEIGQATARAAYMITDFREAPWHQWRNQRRRHFGRVRRGLPRGLGERIFEVVSWNWTPLIALAGIAGMFFDSVLGATWENSGKMGNDSVNFVSTVFAADLALTVVMVTERVGK